MFLQGCRRQIRLLRVLVLLPVLLIWPAVNAAASPIKQEAALTGQELGWLKNRMGVVTVGIAFVPPHTLAQDEHGNYRGVAMDFLTLIEQKLPLRFKTRFYPSYSAMLEGARNGEVDMVFAASATPEREEYLTFTSPYTFLANKIFVRKTAQGFEDLDELSGKTVAVIRSTAIAEHLRLLNPDIKLLELKSARDLMLAVSSGNADAAVSVVASAWWHIKREGISNLDVSGDANFSYAVRFATRKDLPVLAAVLEKGLYGISDEERDAIHRRWLHPELAGVIDKELVYRYAGIIFTIFLVSLVVFALFSIRRLRKEIDQRLDTEVALRTSEERFELAIRGTNDGIWDWNIETDELYLAPRFMEILGHRSPEVGQEWRGTQPWLEKVHPKDKASVQQAVREHIVDHVPLDIRYRVKSEHENWLWLRMRGQAQWNEQGRAVRMCGSIMDITESKRAEDEVRRLAYFDHLTGVANRERFKISLQGAVNKLNVEGQPFAVMFVDLDHFKLINDSLGHRVGDLLLYKVAGLMRQVLPPSSFLGRLDGDEFAILLDTPSGAVEIKQWAEHLLKELSQPMVLDGHELRVSASIGISHWTEGLSTIEQVMEQADIALSEVKREQRGYYRFHEDHMSQRIYETTLLAKDLENAQLNNELFLMFQPQINLQNETVIGCEALLRWHHPEHGMISPAVFIPLAEERGLIHYIGRWVLNESCRQARAWLDQGVHFGGIGVNVSSLQLLAQGFVEQVEEALERFQLPAKYIELEVTETVLVQDIQQAELVMNRLRMMGIRFSIDDFGTGYSSLLYLQRLPISRLKLAQEFVRDTMNTGDSYGQNEAVVAAALQLGKNLRIPVIAEGIETFAQFEWLRHQGCDEGQGYLFARPMMAADFKAFIYHTESHGILPVPVDPESSMMVS